MATTAVQFGAQVDKWVAESKTRLLAVFHESVQRTVAIAQKPVSAGGNLPIQTGFLRYSIRASLSGMPSLTSSKPNAKEARYNYETGPQQAVVLTINNAKLGQTIYIGYTANYAGHVEYGTKNMPGRGFVGKAALQWQETVKIAAENLKARAGVGPSAGPGVQPPL